MELTREQEQLFDLLGAVLFPENATPVEVENVDRLLEEAVQQAVFPLAYQALEQPVRDKLADKWKQLLMASYANNLRVESEHIELDALLRANQIPYVIIKGCVSASYYPDPSNRILGDVDFLVDLKDLNRAGRVLEEAGFSPVKNDHPAHIAYQRGQAEWEMHWKIGGIPQDASGDIIRRYLEDMIDTAQPYHGPMGSFMAPTAFHHGLILLLHTAKHMLTEGIGLRHLCDWAVFVQRLPDEEFCTLFREKLSQIGLWRFACLLTLLAEKYLHCRKHTWTGSREDSLVDAMAADMVLSGNFGKKDPERVNEMFLMVDLEQRTVDETSMVKRFVSALTHRAEERMPIVKRVPVLLPMGWLYVGIGSLLRVRSGQRPPIHFEKAVNGARTRREIYRKFSLFRPEKQ